MKEIYRNHQQDEAYYQLLLKAMEHGMALKSADYYFMKTYLPETDWEAIRPEVLEALQVDEDYNPILFAEEAYERLIQQDLLALRRHPQIWAYLNEHYAQVMIDYRTQLIKEDLVRTQTRSTYYRYAQMIQEMTVIKGGKAAAVQLKRDLMNTYSRRQVMIQEFNQLITD